MNNVNKPFLSDVNGLIIEKLNAYPADVCKLAMQAISLSHDYGEAAVADQLQSVLRKLAKQKESDGR
ncbi:MAG: hypothetical protein WC476_10945 [Phycisphaerae bacterium]|jgi:hypothetical protein